jgi:serine phosphatase RsbU (regulator of sigma subunit)
MGFSATLLVPLLDSGKVRGCLGFNYHGGPHAFSQMEIDFARELGVSVSLALENARLYEQQRETADRLQHALLDIPSEIGRVAFAHLYHSATREATVGGDLYDVFPVKGDRIAVLIGDVAGRGVEAARVATLVKDVVHAFAHQSRRPQHVLRQTNELLVEKLSTGFVTVFFAVLDPSTGLLSYSSAGHPEALLKRADGSVEALETGSHPLGVFPASSWTQSEAQLCDGDLLFLYTDGLIEAKRGEQRFGIERLTAALKRERSSLRRVPLRMLRRVLAFSEGDLTDDAAILAVQLADRKR